MYGYEAPKLIVDGAGRINMLVSYYNFGAYILQQSSTASGSISMTANFPNMPILFEDIFNDKTSRFIVKPNYNPDMNNRHCAPIKVDSIIARAFNFNKIPYQSKRTQIGIYIPTTEYQQIGTQKGILNFSNCEYFIDEDYQRSIIYNGTGSNTATLTLKGNCFINEWKDRQILSFGTTYTPYTIKPAQGVIIAASQCYKGKIKML